MSEREIFDFIMDVVFPALFLLVVGGVIWHYVMAKKRLEAWMLENGFQILRSETRFLRQGPYFLSSSRSQVVYYVEVVDQHGVSARGWVRVGHWLTGAFGSEIEVRWDE